MKYAKGSKNRVFWEKKNSVISRNHRKAKNLKKSTQFTAESQNSSTLGSSLREIIFKLKKTG